MHHGKFHLLDGLKTKFHLAVDRRTSGFTVTRVQTDQIKIVGFFNLGFDNELRSSKAVVLTYICLNCNHAPN